MAGLRAFQQMFRSKRQNYTHIEQLISDFLNELMKMSEHLLGLVSSDAMKTQIKHLDIIVNRFLENTQDVVLISASDIKRVHVEYTIFRLRKDIVGIMEHVGAPTCGDILSVVLGKHFYEMVDNKEWLEIHDKTFIPSKFTRCTNTSIVLDVPGKRDQDASKKVTIHTSAGVFVFSGKYKHDPLGISKHYPIVRQKLVEFRTRCTRMFLPTEFKLKFLAFLSTEQLCCNTMSDLEDKMTFYYSASNLLGKKPLGHLVSLFMTGTFEQRRDMIAQLLLTSSKDKKFIAGFVLNIFSESQDDYNQLIDSLPWDMQRDLQSKVNQAKSSSIADDADAVEDLSYEERIRQMNAPGKVKRKAEEMLKQIKGSRDGDSKSQKYLNGLLRIPFGKYRQEPIFEGVELFRQEIEQVLNVAEEKSLPITRLRGMGLETCNHIDTFFKLYSDIIDKIRPTVKKDMLDHLEALALVMRSKEQKWIEYKLNRMNYIKTVRHTLDDAVWGHVEAKQQLERVIGQWLNGNRSGEIIGLEGPPGTGKTSLARRGLVNCFPDQDGKTRPFAFISLGGSSNGSTLEGHNFTYVGATWGRIVDVLMEAGSLDVIIFFDELDKVSQTERGREIIGILTHLTDTTQNSEFSDRYFEGVQIDLSRILFVFSYNDFSLIDPILRDRITNIKTTPMNLDDKIEVSQRFLIPEILDKLGYSKNDLTLTNPQIDYLINTYTYEAGVRKLKEKLFMIFREYNLKRIFGDSQVDSNAIPQHFIENLFRDKPKMIPKTIGSEPRIGLMTGLYATTLGIGGIIPIEAFRSIADQKLGLVLTGSQGEVMQESMKCARTVAWGLLKQEKQKAIRNDWNEHGPWGLHLHCPEAAVPKDGPSAGGAITLAILSQLTQTMIRHDIGMTGEVNLNGQITVIGGLQAKLFGAKRAGVRTVMIPKENEQDLIALRNDNKTPEDDDFKVITISRVEDAVRHAMLDFSDINLPENGVEFPIHTNGDILDSSIEIVKDDP